MAPEVPVTTFRYDEWARSIPRGLIPNKMNVLVVDVQGMDWEVLVGMGQELATFDVLLVEISTVSLYEGQKLAAEVDSLVKGFGFHCHGGCEPCDHCDRLYRRDKPSLDARKESTFPCDFDGVLKLAKLPNGRNQAVDLPISLGGFQGWAEFRAASQDLFYDVCRSVSPSGKQQANTDVANAEISACALEIESNVNLFVIETCDDFPDEDNHYNLKREDKGV